MNWFYKLKNKIRIIIAVCAWLPVIVFAAITGNIYNGETTESWIAIVGILLFALAIFFTVFTAIAYRKEHPKEAKPYKEKKQKVKKKIDISNLDLDNIPSCNFGKWKGANNNSKDQRRRAQRACSAECTPYSISQENRSGIFSSVNDTYNTTLYDCTCLDFTKRGMPCKHMYRLAIELDLLPFVAESDLSKIKTPIANSITLPSAVESIERLNLSAQKLLRKILIELIYKEKTFYKIRQTETYTPLLEEAFIIKSDNEEGFILNPRFEAIKVGIYTYLTRRNENEIFNDSEGDGDELLIPKGAIYTGRKLTYKKNGEQITIPCFKFKEDEVTGLLDQHGVNRCRNYEPIYSY